MWFVHKTFSVYLGWVALATILNLTIWLDALGWSGAPLSGPIWGAFLLVFAALLYLYLGFSNRDAALSGVLAWASLGIGIKNQSENILWFTCLGVCLFCVLSVLGISFYPKTDKKVVQTP